MYLAPFSLIKKKCTKHLEISAPDVGVTHWGSWTDYVHCKNRVSGFKLRTHGLDFSSFTNDFPNDYTSLNGIQLLCDDNSVSLRLEGDWGKWDESWTKCPIGEHITQLAVRGMQELGRIGDDYGATNVKVVCSSGKLFEGNGGKEGVWTDLIGCPKNMDICGMRAMIQRDQGIGDDTALNRIQLSCCQKPNSGKILFYKSTLWRQILPISFWVLIR